MFHGIRASRSWRLTGSDLMRAGASGASPTGDPFKQFTCFQVFVELILNLPRHTIPGRGRCPGPDGHRLSRKKRLSRDDLFSLANYFTKRNSNLEALMLSSRLIQMGRAVYGFRIVSYVALDTRRPLSVRRSVEPARDLSRRIVYACRYQLANSHAPSTIISVRRIVNPSNVHWRASNTNIGETVRIGNASHPRRQWPLHSPPSQLRFA